MLCGIGVVVGLLALPVGLVMVAFPEAIARKRAPRDERPPEAVVDVPEVAEMQEGRR